MAFIKNVAFDSRFTAKLRTGTRPATPAGLGDAHWDASTEVLSISNAAADDWLEYDLTLLAGLGVGGGGTGFTSYAEGDLLVGNASTTLSKLAIGTNGQVLKVNTGVPGKLEYADETGGVSNPLSAELDANDTNIVNLAYLELNNDFAVTPPATPATDKYRFFISGGFARFKDSAGDVHTLGLASEDVVLRDSWTQIADATIANTVTETTLFGTGAESLAIADIIPAVVSDGKVIELVLSGTLTTKASAAGTLTIRVKIDSNVLLLSPTITLTDGLADAAWKLKVILLCRATGSPSDWVGSAELVIADTTTSVATALFRGEDASNIDTGVDSLALDVTAEFGTADVDNSITSEIGVIRWAYPTNTGF